MTNRCLPDYRREYARRREDMTAAVVAAALRAEGLVVEDAYRPTEGAEQSPDWMLTLDGLPTALEVTRLLPPEHVQKAVDKVTHVEVAARRLLLSRVALGGQVILGLEYSATEAATLDRRRVASDAVSLVAEVSDSLGRIGELPGDPVDFATTLPWVKRADLSLLPGPHDSFYIVHKPDDAQQADQYDFVARTIASKGNQHLAFANRAILAVDAMFDEAEELAEAFAASRQRVPWRRVYQVLRSEATLVFRQEASESSGR